MDHPIIRAYCLFTDLLFALQHVKDQSCDMSDAKVRKTALVAAWTPVGSMNEGAITRTRLYTENDRQKFV